MGNAIRITALLLALGICGILGFRWRASAKNNGAGSPTLASQLGTERGEGSSKAAEATTDDARTSKLDWHEISGARFRIKAALVTGDKHAWAPSIGDLLNPKYKNNEATDLLVELLKEKDWNVKILAAGILLTRGSDEGVATLKEAIKVAPQNGDFTTNMVLEAASDLNLAGKQNDPTYLQAAYHRFPSDEILRIAAIEGCGWVADVVAKKRVSEGVRQSTELIAAELGMSDAESRECYKRLLAAKTPDLRALGNWALYRATGDEAALRNVIASAEAFAGLNTPTPDTVNGSRLALGLLSVTDDPVVAKVEEQLADMAAQGKRMGPFIFDDFLRSLYFVQKDYGFIDQRLLSAMHGAYLKPGAGSDLIWRIASERRTPELEKLALAHNSEAYDLYFIRMKDFPLQAPVILAVRAGPH
jgi:hypothetical protein